MKKWLIIGVLVLIVAITIWYLVHAKKDANRLESTEKKMQPEGNTMKVVHSAVSGKGSATVNTNPQLATKGRGK